MKNSRTFLILVFIIGFSNAVLGANTLSDETEFGPDLSEPLQAVDSYHQALGVWKTAEDISRWAAGSFRYDKSRASQLSTNRRRRQKEISIYDPSELFAKKAGICVDLARFGFETLKSIDPASHPRYLMIEFEPVKIDGDTFRLHWLVSFKRNGMRYFFCDSKRPGYIAGPYTSAQEFIRYYGQFRGRKIVAHRELETYRKQKKSNAKTRRVIKTPKQSEVSDR